MKITRETVDYVARLARLFLTYDEKEKFTLQLNDILTYIDKLNELDTSNIEPTFHSVPLKNVFREDKVEPSLPQEKVLANGPNVEDTYFKVQSVIE